MKKNVFLSFLLLLIGKFLIAQNGVAISSTPTTPDNSAILELKSTNKGLLLPRVALVNTLDVVTIPTPKTGLFVYNTTDNTSLDPGIYFYDGAKWVAPLLQERTGTTPPNVFSWSFDGPAGALPCGVSFVGYNAGATAGPTWPALSTGFTVPKDGWYNLDFRIFITDNVVGTPFETSTLGIVISENNSVATDFNTGNIFGQQVTLNGYSTIPPSAGFKYLKAASRYFIKFVANTTTCNSHIFNLASERRIVLTQFK